MRPWPRDVLAASGRDIGVADERPSSDDVLGPVRPRGGWVILRRRHSVAEWGDTRSPNRQLDPVVVVRWIAKPALARLLGVGAVRH